MSHISSVLMKPSTYFANDILVCNFAPQGSMNVSGFERDIPRKPLQNNVLVFEFDRVLYGAKEWVNFIENIQFQMRFRDHRYSEILIENLSHISNKSYNFLKKICVETLRRFY